MQNYSAANTTLKEGTNYRSVGAKNTKETAKNKKNKGNDTRKKSEH